MSIGGPHEVLPPHGLERERTVSFRELIGAATSRLVVIVDFLAVLDLIRRGYLEARPEFTVTGPPLTASFESFPASHTGSNFTFRISFSEEPKEGFSYKTLRDHAFTVTGGEVAGARRLDGDSDTPNIRWEITVSPDSGGDVTITLPVTEDCDADGAICANGGNGDKKLSGPLEFTVSGPGG